MGISILAWICEIFGVLNAWCAIEGIFNGDYFQASVNTAVMFYIAYKMSKVNRDLAKISKLEKDKEKP